MNNYVQGYCNPTNNYDKIKKMLNCKGTSHLPILTANKMPEPVECMNTQLSSGSEWIWTEDRRRENGSTADTQSQKENRDRICRNNA